MSVLDEVSLMHRVLENHEIFDLKSNEVILKNSDFKSNQIKITNFKMISNQIQIKVKSIYDEI